MSQQAITSNSELNEMKEAASSSSPEDITQSLPEIQEVQIAANQVTNNIQEKIDQPILINQSQKIDEANNTTQVITNKQGTTQQTTRIAQPDNAIIQQTEVQTQRIQTQNVLYFQPRTIKIIHIIFFFFMLYVHLSEVFNTDDITSFQHIKSSNSTINSQKKKDKSKNRKSKTNSKTKKNSIKQDQYL